MEDRGGEVTASVQVGDVRASSTAVAEGREKSGDERPRMKRISRRRC